MWFKNLHLYRLQEQPQIDATTLEEALAEKAARPIGGQEVRRTAWDHPAGRSGTQLHHDLQGHRLMTMLRQERLLPSEVVREEVSERVAEIESQTGLPVHRAIKQDIKEQVFEELLPRAFIKRQRIDVWWDTTRSLIAVNAASRARAEEALDLLRETLGSLKVTPLATQTLPMRTMTQWLSDDSSRPAELLLGDKVELIAKGDDGVVRGRHVDLDSDDIQQLLATGRQASQLELEIESVMSFTLHDDMTIKGVRFSDSLIEEAGDVEDDGDATVRLEADFLLMTRALGASIDSLIGWMGGEA